MPDAESPLSERDEAVEPEVVGVLRFELSGLALGPDYPATAVSAEIGRGAIAAAASIRSTHCCCPGSVPATAPTGT